ncbi:hypothetical protein [Halalkalibaculum sp. DA384]|uniref:hypothetical protein n=1 Tax=Halalkalibaculum sp. DA384 TaxID=3373606 RepID=UPI003754ABB7
MIDLYRKILERTLFNSSSDKSIALIPQEENSTDEDRIFNIPPDLFPENVEIYRLSESTEYIDEMTTIFEREEPDRVFIFPSLVKPSNVSKEIKHNFVGRNLSDWILESAVEHLKSETLLGAFLLPSFAITMSGRPIREKIFAKNQLYYYLENDFSLEKLGLNLHSQFSLSTLFLTVGTQESTPVRFFKISNRSYSASESEIWKDFKILCNQGGGKTRYGFVRREPIKPGDRIAYDLLDPSLKEKVKELNKLGDVRNLNEFFELKRGLHLARDSDELLENYEDGAIPVLEGRNIKSDGTLDEDNIRYWVKDPDPELLIKENALCVRTVINLNHSNLVLSGSDYLNSFVPGHSIIVLEPRLDITTEERQIIVEYLRSNLAAEWLSAHLAGLTLHASILNELPIPILNENLRVAVNDLRIARDTFHDWEKLGDDSVKKLFEVESSEEGKNELLKKGRLLRQRLEAAKEVDKLSYRVRNLFPHPIAYRWREIEASNPNLEGYKKILETFEVLLIYISTFAIISSRKLSNFQIKKVEEIAERLSSPSKHGISLGDWIGLLRECNEKNLSEIVEDWIPFQEVFHFLRDENANQVLGSLADRRNDEAHLRGPSGKDVEEYYDNAKKELEILLEHTEFLSEFQLIQIESTKWDSVRELNTYTYRKLMGDHPLVPEETSLSEDNQLEADSLYIKDRNGTLNLLRPYLTRRECPSCGRPAIFHLDKFYEKNGICTLKSLEHGHTAEDKEITEIFRKVGMLK